MGEIYNKFGNEYYKKKIISFLHDPIEKYQNIKEHEDKAQKNIYQLYKILLSKEELEQMYRQADYIASALSRVVLKYSPAVGPKKAEYIDIFSLDRISLNDGELKTGEGRIFTELLDVLSNLESQNIDELEKIRFWLLWRITPEIYRDIYYIPADTRAPNHSIYDHLVQTSCIAGSLYQRSIPGFLLVSISPVQEFISRARKTTDLWAGSYFLSYLTFRLIIKLADLLGPDHIIFPNLLGQPLVDYHIKKEYSKYLEQLKNNHNLKQVIEKSLEKNVTPDKLLIANIPNRFLSIIPLDMIENQLSNLHSIPNLLEEEMKKTFQSISKELVKVIMQRELIQKMRIKHLYENSIQTSESLEKIIFENLISYFQLYWVVLPWSKEENLEKIEYILKDYKNLNLNYNSSTTYNVITKILDTQLYRSGKLGILYSILLEMTEKLLGVRKTIRNPIKDSLLVLDKDKCDLCGEFNVVLSVEEENLCALCLTKRFLRDIIQEKLQIEDGISFPSTSEISSVPSKILLYSDKDLKKRIQDFSQKLNQELQISITTDPVPKIIKQFGITRKHNIEGQWLMEENYSSKKIKSEYGILKNQELLDQLKKEIKEILKGIEITRYYGLLMMDGDNIGGWLKGDYNPPIREVLHPEVVKKFENDNQEPNFSHLIQSLMQEIHPNSPSIHQAFSRRLSMFSVDKVKEIVEDECYGKLIYAGGDDVLAILPLTHVINCAYKLNQAFVKILRSKKRTESGYPLKPASASIGIVISHYKYPLYLAFEELRETEKIAKSKFNKDSLVLKLIKHSGEVIISGIKWQNFDKMYETLEKFEYIPSSFIYDLADFKNTLYIENSKDFEFFSSQMKMLFSKKAKDKQTFKLIKDLLNSYIESELPDNTLDAKVKYFVNMLLIFRFIFPQIRKYYYPQMKISK